ncbi:MAG TPA: IPT/TIG domain-containing protein [Solirubrobacteraceae bacterium]|nr:IPT/TIG domain-containing protein [Solirubrobacteraceae bacterium]
MAAMLAAAAVLVAAVLVPGPALAEELIQQGSKLTTTGEIGAGEFGATVALSGDGETALIGSGEHAYVFTGSSSSWSEQATLPPGSGLALSADGNTALVATGAGTLVFTRSGSSWTQQATLVVGVSVAVSADGNTVLVGAPATDEGAGAAWIYTRSGESWSQQAELTGGEAGAGSEFGASVALSADGSTALVGGPGPGAERRTGAAWVFARSGTEWAQQGPVIIGPSVFGNVFERSKWGTGVALSADGSTALIGGVSNNGAAFGANVASGWVYTRSGSTWTQQAEEPLIGELQEHTINLGRDSASVALSADGNTALIGGGLDAGLGAAWLFTRTGSTWSQHGTELQGSDEVGAFEGLFGAGVALASAANTALIGDPRDNGRIGAAWMFASSPTVIALDTAAGASEGGTTVRITGANFNDVSAVNFGSASARSFTVGSESSITAVSPPGTGTVDVTVTTAQGESTTSTADRFSYGPAVTSLSPDSGLPSGGTPVHITGAGFEGATAVDFGAVAATSFTVNSDTSITAVSPPGVDTVDVTVSTPRGATPTSGGDHFGYASITNVSTGASTLGEIVTATDGSLWFIVPDGIGRMTPEGALTLFTHTLTDVTKLAPASDGDAWFANAASLLFLITPEGTVTERPPTLAHAYNTLEAITGGPEGCLWFSYYDVYSERAALQGTGEPCCSVGLPEVHRLIGGVSSMATGADDDLWMSWDGTGVLRATAAGVARQYPVGTGVSAMTVGPGDDLWFSDPEANEIGRLTPEGVLTRFSQGITSSPEAIVTGAEGDIWFTEPGAHAIGRITPEGAVTEFSEGIDSAPVGITVGAEGDIWFTEESGQLGRLAPAGPPEFGRCVKVGAHRGHFTGAACQLRSATLDGRYEWYAAVAKARFAITLRGGAVTLRAAKAKVRCDAESGYGEYSGARAVKNVVLILSGCAAAGHACTTAGLSTGDLETKSLEGVLGWEDRSELKVALDLYPLGNTGPLMEYQCAGGALTTVRGSVLAPVKTDQMRVASPLKYTLSDGKQKPEQLEGEPNDVLSASLGGEPSEPLGLTGWLTLVGEEAVEINTAGA